MPSLPLILSTLGLTTAERLPARAPFTPSTTDFPLPAPTQCHEWFLDHPQPSEPRPSGSGRRHWHPPLTLLTALALQLSPNPNNHILCIGRRCWPTFHHLSSENSPATLKRFLFLDPLSDAERFWAIAEALRCPAVSCVLADASAITPTLSRRLQLAAESANAVALLARPPWELDAPSAAATRWRVAPHPSPENPQWTLELLSCRGQHVGQDAPRHWTVQWTFQVTGAKGALHFSPQLGHRPPPQKIDGQPQRITA